jgi:hypothetical protein
MTHATDSDRAIAERFIDCGSMAGVAAEYRNWNYGCGDYAADLDVEDAIRRALRDSLSALAKMEALCGGEEWNGGDFIPKRLVETRLVRDAIKESIAK